jgi:hypothetical protein
MHKQFGYRTSIRVDRKAGSTYLALEILTTGLFWDRRFDWENYNRACRQNLYRVAAEESFPILYWSVDLSEERESITHSILVLKALDGALPLRLTRALMPPKGYTVIDFLEQALQNGWPIEPILKAQVEVQSLRRYDQQGKPLPEPLRSQLLARAVMESDWRKLISPLDKPWAFLNTATQRIYKRDYQNTEVLPPHSPDAVTALRSDLIASRSQLTGDDLVVNNVGDVFKAAGWTQDSIEVRMATIAGKKWRELPEYLSNNSGSAWDGRRVEAARGRLRRLDEQELRDVALASSEWSQRQKNGTVYRQRLPDGAPWNGLWTYAHPYQGEELEILREIMLEERKKLLRKNN